MSNNDAVRKRLMEKYHAKESGTWRILGEDPNCDFGGHHHEPELGSVTGTYENVVDYAMTMKGFFQWGSGGRIVKVSPTLNVAAGSISGTYADSFHHVHEDGDVGVYFKHKPDEEERKLFLADIIRHREQLVHELTILAGVERALKGIK